MLLAKKGQYKSQGLGDFAKPHYRVGQASTRRATRSSPGGRLADRRGTIAAIFLAARCDFDNKNGAAPLPAGF
jgi:hypothetical protein